MTKPSGKAGRASILYINADPGTQIPEMTLAGIRRYARAVGWCAEAIASAESAAEEIPALIASFAPVVGCVYESANDAAPPPPNVFGGLPVVYLHAARLPAGNQTARVTTDNAAVARTAFRELSEGRPAAYAVAGVRESSAWTLERERVFRALAAESGLRCATFQRRRDELPNDRAKRLAAWVARLPDHTAVFATNDLASAEIVAAAKAAARAIPNELTLLGVDNRPNICEDSTPTLSSIQIDFERAGYMAAEIIAAGGGGATASFGPLLAVRRESTGGSGRRDKLILLAVERIRREACEGLTAAAMAASFPGTRRLFELRFREATGHSVLDEIQHIRLERACALLSRTDTPISAIAAFCGFRSDRALRKVFLARAGMSMQKWRSKNRR